MSNPVGREKLFSAAANGNTQALVFLETLFDVADIADDIQDEPHKDGRVTSLLLKMTALPANQFYAAHASALRSLMLTAVLSWDLSNEVDSPHYAAQLEQVVFYVALVCGGEERAKQIVRDWHARSR